MLRALYEQRVFSDPVAEESPVGIIPKNLLSFSLAWTKAGFSLSSKWPTLSFLRNLLNGFVGLMWNSLMFVPSGIAERLFLQCENVTHRT
jgi:hypothetical protein